MFLRNSVVIMDGDDSVTVSLDPTHNRPSPPERPAARLYRKNSAPELRSKLSEVGLSTKGTKADMSIRFAAHTEFVDKQDVSAALTKKQLLRRTKLQAGTSKDVLCTEYMILGGLNNK